MARESAEQQLAGEEKLYEVGRSTTFLLLQRQNELTVAQPTNCRRRLTTTRRWRIFSGRPARHSASTIFRLSLPRSNIILECGGKPQRDAALD